MGGVQPDNCGSVSPSARCRGRHLAANLIEGSRRAVRKCSICGRLAVVLHWTLLCPDQRYPNTPVGLTHTLPSFLGSCHRLIRRVGCDIFASFCIPGVMFPLYWLQVVRKEVCLPTYMRSKLLQGGCAAVEGAPNNPVFNRSTLTRRIPT